MQRSSENGTFTTAAGGHDAIRAFDACLYQRDLAALTHQQLVRAQAASRLDVRGRPLCTVLRPRFLTESDEDSMKSAASTLAALFERAGSYLLGSDRLLDRIGASDAERDIWSVDPGYEGFTLTSRLDAFMGVEHTRFVEYNAESPAGIGFCDLLTEIFEELPAVRLWRGDRPRQEPAGRRHLLGALLWAYTAWGGTGLPTMAIIDWDDVITRRDFELCAEYFREHHIETVITDPRALEYRNGTVWCGDRRITLVYRRVLLDELLKKSREVGPLLQAYRDRAICMVNSPRSKLLHKKTVFALLSEGVLPIHLSPEECAVVEATIPWTRIVGPGRTSHDGRSVDLPSHLLAEQESLAIKPADDYGGRGVVLGWDTTADEWEQAVETAISGGYVVQQRVPVPEEPYPVWADNGVSPVLLLQDTDPFLFRGTMGCVLTRLSGSALLNVTAGTGSAVPTFILAAEEN